MGLLNWLTTRTPALSDPVAPHPRVEPLLSASDEVLPEPSDDGSPIDLDPLFAMIEYEAADGTTTRRRVTFRRLRPNRQGDWVAEAWCHERNAPRSFRIDGIVSVFNEDGEVLDPEAWWRAAGVLIPKAGSPQFDGRALRDALRPGLSLLVALAHADGRLCAAEVGAIQGWAETEAFARGLPITCEISDQLGVLIPTMRPTAEALPGYFASFAGGDPSRAARFHRAVREVAHADGEIPDSEIAFTAMIREWGALDN
jgi:hypothetical protein